MKVVGIIPARMAATRLPNKPLVDIAGKPMIQHVWERSKRASSMNEVLVATCDEEIAVAVRRFGGRVVMTSSLHRSGTDRLAEAARNLNADVIVNIQGDEPLLKPEVIDSAVGPFVSDPTVEMTSLMCPCPEEERDNPSTVKVVHNLNGDALYFTRAQVPFPRTNAGVPIMQHIGLYAYRRQFLLTYSDWDPTPLEMTEGLEQLRVLENGRRIRMVRTAEAPLSVDTQEDLDRVRQLLQRDAVF